MRLPSAATRTLSPGRVYEHQTNGHAPDSEEEPSERTDEGSSHSSSLLNDRVTESERALQSESVEDTSPFSPHFFSSKRHLTGGNPAGTVANLSQLSSWKQKNKLKTANAALVVCLNIDVDPPDVVKTNPCAFYECWVDPRSLPSNKALEAIGNNLHHQFECLNQRIKYKPYLDPSYEEAQKFCQNLRKMAKDERCLFYYNGHGVPKPTPSGELWVFNKNYSQYIPVSLVEIQNWLGSPCIYIWECSAAGNLLTNFISYAEKRDADANMRLGGYPDGMVPFMESIQLAACLSHETLPMNPKLPADLFTSCLTSPIDIALRWYLLSMPVPSDVTTDMIQRIPGDLKDRRTPLGELQWIFTSITDTIAWTTFSKDIFHRLYRSDLLVACLFRNFLLAERIMKNYHCTPHTYPPLPPTNTHPMWAQWDMAVAEFLRQLPDLLRNEEIGSTGSPEQLYTYVPSRFFTDQLAAFEVWISRGGSALTKRGPASLSPSSAMAGTDIIAGVPSQGDGLDHLVPRKPPEQLPIVLQLLLSLPHRYRVLLLLSKFVDLGPWAVYFALNIGIFPFIAKLLQSSVAELRPVLTFIWARILAVDPTCQSDLYVNHGYKYFANALALAQDDNSASSNTGPEYRAMCCFILAAICRGFPQAQHACWQERVFDSCFERLDDDDALPRKWMALCIAQMWDGNDDIKIYGVDRGTRDKLIAMLSDSSPEVRTAALYALGTFMGASGSSESNNSSPGGGGTGSMYHLDERTHFHLEVSVATGAALSTKEDASPMVRKELLVLLSCLVKEWRGYFVIVAWLYWEEECARAASFQPRSRAHEDIVNQAVTDWLDSVGGDDNSREENRVILSSFYTLYVFMLELSVDPYTEVATHAQTIVDYIMALLLDSPFSRMDSSSLGSPPPLQGKIPISEPRTRLTSLQSSSSGATIPPVRNPLTRSDSATSAASIQGTVLRKTASFANSLKNLAGQFPFPSPVEEQPPPGTQSGTRTRTNSADLTLPPSPIVNNAVYNSPYHDKPPARLERESSGQSKGEEQPNDFEPFEVMEALIEEDMERLRARRRKKTQQRHYQQYAHDTVLSPSGSTFSHDSTNSSASILLGLGTGAGLKDVLPLKSHFFDWCCEFYTETQMRHPEDEEPGSVQYNEKMWRQQRNEKVTRETQAQAEVAKHCKWDKTVTSIHHPGFALNLTFHGFDPLLFASDNSSMISVYDWTTRKRILHFNNGNPLGTHISSLTCINQAAKGILIVGTTDGIVRMYRNYDTSSPQMVTAFRALSTMVPMKRGSGLLVDWQQNHGLVLAGGDSRTIRIWDANTETIANEIVTQSESPLTSLSADPYSPSFIAASFGDGSVQLYDKRIDNEDAVVRSYREHTSWVHGVRWQKGAGKDFVSASADGEVRLWDMRRARTSIARWSLFSDGISAFDVHDQCSVFAATGTLSSTSTRWRQQTTIVHSLYAPPPDQPSVLSRLTFPSNLHHPPPRDASLQHPTASLAFHPHEMLLGIGGADGTIRLMGANLADHSDSAFYMGAIFNPPAQNGYFASIRSYSP